MPISDIYVVQYLLQATQAAQDPIVWQEKGCGHIADFRGIRIELDRVPSRTHSRLYITLSRAWEEVCVEEPLNTGLFRERYKDDDERELARLMKELATTIGRQCATRRKTNLELGELVREGLYRRLVGVSGTEA